jgi:TonB dependent receptor.
MYSSSNTDYKITAAISYKILKGLSASLRYGYERGVMDNLVRRELESFYTRNLINTYSQIDPVTKEVTYGMPVGEIRDVSGNSIQAHNGRAQIDYQYQKGPHMVSALAGTEFKDYDRVTNSSTLYGYDPATLVNQNTTINPDYYYPYYYSNNSGRINTAIYNSGNTDHYLSYYMNASYSYDGRYIVSGSARKDESNLFGVKSNQKGIPLWSTGLAWVASKEKFYTNNWLPFLKLRFTFGYTGNVNNSLSALLTARKRSSNINAYNALFASIDNPPNADLRWEKVRNVNLGLDFMFKENRISGSIDLWRKKGMDLIGGSPIAAQTGLMTFTGNTANTLTRGIDIQINSINLTGSVKWQSMLLFNYSKDEVTRYLLATGSNSSVVISNTLHPLVGFPQNAVFSYRYAGLDEYGDPQGYLDGKISKDYSAIMNSTNRGDLRYHGPNVPVFFGSVLNTFSWHGLEFSFNIAGSFGHYFRRTSLDESMLFSTTNMSARHADYDKRWQQPGDEMKTNVPALKYPLNYNRSAIYKNSEVLVEKGDHLRLRDLRFAYTFNRRSDTWFPGIQVFAMAGNVCILWRANRYGIDPEAYNFLPAARSFSFGVKADL